MDNTWNFPEYRYTDDTRNETIVFEFGYRHHDSTSGYFCKVSMDGVCVEAFALTKRGALKIARKTWKKIKDQKELDKYGYPRECKSG